PSHAKRVQLYKDEASHLFHRFQVESQLDAIHNPVVGLRSGGYIVINSTEALVAIDVNSGRATRERNIEETALRTNQEAADEIARQLRLRDLAGLIVIDFIDMEENRNNAAVERRLKEAMRHDRARIQVGRISPFGLLELSRQRLRPSLIEASTEICRFCRGTGHVRSTESTALHVLRGIEEEGIRNRSTAINIAVPTVVALYILNNKRAALAELEQRHNLRLTLAGDDSLIPPDYRMERSKTPVVAAEVRAPVSQPDAFVEDEEETIAEEEDEASAPEETQVQDQEGGRRRSRRRRRRRDEGRPLPAGEAPARFAQPLPESGGNGESAESDEQRADIDVAAPADD
ncbi:MAG: ribonuclease E/G, partial [Dongiaceae bacterium]